MAEISIPEEEFGEPVLNYWRPVSKPVPAALPFVNPDCIGNGYENSGWQCQGVTYGPPPVIAPCSAYQQLLPCNDVMPYIPNQETALSPGLAMEGERRRMAQYSTNANHDLYTLSANPNYDQDCHAMTDHMIQDEVTRAAKTLFSKRNRTLLHWLNPDVNKNQIKVDADAAWELLPAVQKKFFISQVLGKFSPHVSSLMVNPQLEPLNVESSSSCMMNNLDTCELRRSAHVRARRSQKRPQSKNKPDKSMPAVKPEIKTKCEENFDSGLVIDTGEEEKPKLAGPAGVQRVKRKYTKRKRKANDPEENSVEPTSDANKLPVHVQESKLTESKADLPIVKVEPGTESSSDFKEVKIKSSKVKTEIVEKPKCETDISQNGLLPRPKRKYVKRKLIRKKYKKREPKQIPQKTDVETCSLPDAAQSNQNELELLNIKEEEMEIDLWVELEGDSILTNEEVDHFFDSIEDPDRLFCEFGIIEN